MYNGKQKAPKSYKKYFYYFNISIWMFWCIPIGGWNFIPFFQLYLNKQQIREIKEVPFDDAVNFSKNFALTFQTNTYFFTHQNGQRHASKTKEFPSCQFSCNLQDQHLEVRHTLYLLDSILVLSIHIPAWTRRRKDLSALVWDTYRLNVLVWTKRCYYFGFWERTLSLFAV